MCLIAVKVPLIYIFHCSKMESESFIVTVTIYLIFLQLIVFTQTINMAKRKGQAMLDRVSKMARALGEERGDAFVPMDNGKSLSAVLPWLHLTKNCIFSYASSSTLYPRQ